MFITVVVKEDVEETGEIGGIDTAQSTLKNKAAIAPTQYVNPVMKSTTRPVAEASSFPVIDLSRLRE